jgi:hypothetical protein
VFAQVSEQNFLRRNVDKSSSLPLKTLRIKSIPQASQYFLGSSFLGIAIFYPFAVNDMSHYSLMGLYCQLSISVQPIGKPIKASTHIGLNCPPAFIATASFIVICR